MGRQLRSGGRLLDHIDPEQLLEHDEQGSTASGLGIDNDRQQGRDKQGVSADADHASKIALKVGTAMWPEDAAGSTPEKIRASLASKSGDPDAGEWDDDPVVLFKGGRVPESILKLGRAECLYCPAGACDRAMPLSGPGYCHAELSGEWIAPAYQAGA